MSIYTKKFNGIGNYLIFIYYIYIFKFKLGLRLYKCGLKGK